MSKKKDRFAEVRELIRRKIREDGVPSVAVAVAWKGEIVWAEGFGWADRERRMRADEHTMYSLASISKPITATGLMVLRERGLVDLDKPMDEYLGSAKLNGRAWDAAGATVRRVANHTAGLPFHYQFFYADEAYRRPPMDETIRRYGNLVTAPGERYNYSNLGYGILDYAIERLSGCSYGDFMRREVFVPLGLTRMSVDLPGRLADIAAARYGEDGVAYPFYEFDHPGGSAIWSSAHDLVRFGMYHLKGRLEDQKAILSDAALDEMHVGPGADGGGYGLGWACNVDDRGYRSFGHNGGMGGVSTVLKAFPDEDLVVAALCNAASDTPGKVLEAIVGSVLPGYAERAAATPAATPAAAEAAFEPAEGLRGKWEGSIFTHRGEVPLWVQFREGGDVHAQTGEGLVALVNEPKCVENRFTGMFLGDVETEDAGRRPYVLLLDLTLRGESLNGGVTAATNVNGLTGGTPGRRIGNALTYWVDLRRA